MNKKDNKNERGAEADASILSIGERVAAEDAATQILNFQRTRELQLLYEALKMLLHGQNVEVSYRLNEPFKESGSVTVEGARVVFADPKWFRGLADLANNVEVYPLVNGKLRMTFTFHNLTVKL